MFYAHCQKQLVLTLYHYLEYKADFVVAELGNWGFTTRDRVKTQNGEEWQLKLFVSYRIPQGADHEPDTSDLYLKITAVISSK